MTVLLISHDWPRFRHEVFIESNLVTQADSAFNHLVIQDELDGANSLSTLGQDMQ